MDLYDEGNEDRSEDDGDRVPLEESRWRVLVPAWAVLGEAKCDCPDTGADCGVAMCWSINARGIRVRLEAHLVGEPSTEDLGTLRQMAVMLVHGMVDLGAQATLALPAVFFARVEWRRVLPDGTEEGRLVERHKKLQAAPVRSGLGDC